MSLSTYINSLETATEPTPESVNKMLEMIKSRLDTLVQNNGKTPLVIPESTPQWVRDQINTSNVAYVIIEPMLAK